MIINGDYSIKVPADVLYDIIETRENSEELWERCKPEYDIVSRGGVPYCAEWQKEAIEEMTLLGLGMDAVEALVDWAEAHDDYYEFDMADYYADIKMQDRR